MLLPVQLVRLQRRSRILPGAAGRGGGWGERWLSTALLLYVSRWTSFLYTPRTGSRAGLTILPVSPAPYLRTTGDQVERIHLLKPAAAFFRGSPSRLALVAAPNSGSLIGVVERSDARVVLYQWPRHSTGPSTSDWLSWSQVRDQSGRRSDPGPKAARRSGVIIHCRGMRHTVACTALGTISRLHLTARLDLTSLVIINPGFLVAHNNHEASMAGQAAGRRVDGAL